MTRTFFRGGSYPDAYPSGAYVVQFAGSHFETHQGRVDLPPGESFGLMFVRASIVGGFHFAGLSHESPIPLVWEWRDGAWSDPFHTETGRIVYDHNGQIRDEAPAGYQFVDDSGIPISRLVTYPVLDGLNEWSLTADLRIGQGHEDGQGVCVRTADGVVRQLEPGDCRFVTVHRAGERVAISYVKPDGAVIVQTTLAELRSLPAVGIQIDAPPITPIPRPVPSKPEPVMPSNQLAAVQSIRVKYPTPLGAQHPAFLIEAARATGAKLLRKDAGSHVTLPDGRNVSQDILMFGDQGVDFLSDAEGAAIPAWQEKGQILGEYYDVSEPNPGTPPPNPGIPPSADLLAEVAALKVRVGLLESRRYRIALVPE